MLDTRRARAIDLLLAGRTIPDVATEFGVNRRTVWRWTTEPAFAAELARGRDARRCARSVSSPTPPQAAPSPASSRCSTIRPPRVAEDPEMRNAEIVHQE